MNKIISFIALAGILGLVNCTNDSLLDLDFEQVVIRAYLYAGESVTDIQITSTLALGSEDTLAPPVNDARVSLFKDGSEYKLRPDPEKNGYYFYDGSNLLVEPDDLFEIKVDYFGEVASGTTVVPQPPQNITSSSNVLMIPTGFIGFNQDSISQIQIRWDQKPDALYFVTIDNTEHNPEQISFGGRFQGPAGQSPRRFISVPRSSNEYQIARFNLTHYGRHLVRVYHVNQEYADLYISRQQDSRDLNEPLTNIHNGLGVFSAFSSDSVIFTAYPQ